MVNVGNNKIAQLVAFFEQKRGYIFLAKLCLRTGKDLTKIKASDPEDIELLKRVKAVAKELGVTEAEIESGLQTKEGIELK